MLETSYEDAPRPHWSYRTTRPLSIFQFFTFYDAYWQSFYRARPGLATLSFHEQREALYRDCFGAFHMFAPFLRAAGHDCQFTIANCEPLQKQWAKEQGLRYNDRSWQWDILRAQISAHAPDVLYSMNPIDFDGRFLKTLRSRPPLTMAWRAADMSGPLDWSDIDLIVSHLSVCRKKAHLLGVPHTAHFWPGIPSFIPSLVADEPRTFDVVFSGQVTPQHGKRNELLGLLAYCAEQQGWSVGFFLASGPYQLPEFMTRYDQGARWGLDMFRALRSGRVVVNAEIDVAEGEAGNLRLFETTAVGSCLLTEWHPNLDWYYRPDHEVLSFKDPDEMLSKIQYALSHEREREEIAKRGQARALSDHSMERMTERLDAIVQEHWDAARRSRKEHGETKGTKIIETGEKLPEVPQPLPERNVAKESVMNVNAIIDKAIEALKVADNQTALTLAERAKSEKVVVRDLDHIRAIALIGLKREREAQAALEEELRAFPDNGEARRLLGEVISEISRTTPSTLQQASSECEGGCTGACERREKQTSTPQATTEDPNDLAKQAVECLQTGRGVDAMRLADRVAALCGDQPGVHWLRFLALDMVGRHEEALKAVERELMVNPTHDAARERYRDLSVALSRKQTLAIHPEQRSYQSKLPSETLKSIQAACHNYSYRGVPMIKNPFDFAIYPLLLWNVKPKTIIEIGSKNGGSALWFGDLMNNFGIEGHVYSLDIVRVDDVSHPRVTFMEANGRDLGATLTPQFLASLPRPRLVIEDADHSYETSSAVLRFFHPLVGPEEYIVIEDGIISDLGEDPKCNSGPHRALKEFIAAHPGEYEMDESYLDFFGYNFTWCTNGFLKKRKYPINGAVSKQSVIEFLSDDPTSRGMESQMSINERYQLHSLLRTVLRPEQTKIGWIEIGSYAGASLRLTHDALRRYGKEMIGVAVEPGGAPSFHALVRELAPTIHHLSGFSHDKVGEASDTLARAGIRPDFIMVDGDHSYEGVRQDILDYYPLLAPGGVIAFHDFLPALTPENQAAIFFHHGGAEPGIRRACLELMEGEFRAELLELPLLYPTDPTQTQPHLPVIPGVFSTLRAYRKPR